MKRKNEHYVIIAELQVLYIICQNYNEYRGKVSENNFPHEEAIAILHAIDTLVKNNEEITISSLYREANLISDKIDQDIIETFFSFGTSFVSFDRALEILNKAIIKYNIKKYSQKLYEISSQAGEVDEFKISELINNLHNTYYNNIKNSNIKNIEDCFSMYENELHRRIEGKTYIFNDKLLDIFLTRGSEPGQIILIAGSTGSGKSTYVLNICNNLINANIPCMYVSLEMDIISTLDRLLSIRTEVPLMDWYKTVKQNSSIFFEILKKEKENLLNKPFSIIENPNLSIDQLQSYIIDFKKRFNVPYTCVVIDLITQVKDFSFINKNYSLANTIELAINKLNALAKQENVCLICVSQMNREADNIRLQSIEEIEELRPTINHIKNSNALAERSRVVLSVFRKKYYAERLFPEYEEVKFMPDILEIQILKQSQGVAGKLLKYVFDTNTFKVTPYNEEEPVESFKHNLSSEEYSII